MRGDQGGHSLGLVAVRRMEVEEGEHGPLEVACIGFLHGGTAPAARVEPPPVGGILPLALQLRAKGP
jgi:hypothetical protein